jgi:excisionase family DNA binding protein
MSHQAKRRHDDRPVRDDVATKDDIAELRSFLESALAQLASQLKGVGDSRFMSVEQCAAYIGRTPRAVEGLVYRAAIPVIKTGRRVTFDRERIDRWMERHGRRGRVL